MRRVSATKRSAAVVGQVIVDSGPLIALLTWPVATEVCALLARRIHNAAALDFLRWCDHGGIALDRPELHSVSVVLRLSEQFADLPFDLADASVAEAADRLEISNILTIDADSDVYRNDRGNALRNVLRE